MLMLLEYCISIGLGILLLAIARCRQRRQFRRQFPLMHATKLIYLDNAATSQKPAQVISAMSSFYSTSNAGVHRATHQLGRAASEEYETARSVIEMFINAPPRSVVITRGATHALNEVANGLVLRPGDIVVVSEAAHHSNYLPWLAAAARATASVVTVPWNATTIDWELALTDQVAVVAIHHVSHVFGTLTPVDTIRARMRAVCPEALLVVDACQSLPHIPVDVAKMECDVLVGSGHKMFGPTGVGFMFMSDNARRAVKPFIIGGGSITNARGDSSEYPHCFEPGTPPVAEAVGLAAACRFIERWKMPCLISDLEKEFMSLSACTILSDGNPRVIPLVAISFKGVHAEDVAALCDLRGVCMRAGNHCAALLHEKLGLRQGSLRISCQGYNTREEIALAVKSIRKAVDKLLQSTKVYRCLCYTQNIDTGGVYETIGFIDHQPSNKEYSKSTFPSRKHRNRHYSW